MIREVFNKDKPKIAAQLLNQIILNQPSAKHSPFLYLAILTNLSNVNREHESMNHHRPSPGRVRHTQQHSCNQVLNKELTVHSDYLWGVGVKMTFIFVFYILQYRLNFYKEHGFYNKKLLTF